MRRHLMLAAALAVAAIALPTAARAHFLWLDLEPAASPPLAYVYFGELPGPGEPELVGKVAATRLRVGGEPVALEQEEAGLVARLSALPAEVEAACDYGVIERGGPPFLLLYSARAQTRPVAEQATAAEADDRPRLAWIEAEGRDPVVLATRRGKPLANAAVKVFGPKGESAEATTDEAGRLAVPDLPLAAPPCCSASSTRRPATATASPTPKSATTPP